MNAARPNAENGGPNNWMHAPVPVGMETKPRASDPRQFDSWTNPAHLAAGALDAMRVRHLMPAERERMAYMAGDIAAANIWAQFIDTAAENENQQEEIETLKDEAADLKADIENLEAEIKTERAYICDLQARIQTLEKQIQGVSA